MKRLGDVGVRLCSLVRSPPPALSRQLLESEFESDSPARVAEALVSAALEEADWQWVQELLMCFTQHPDTDVRSVAIT